MMYLSQNILLYTLNLYSAICQLYLNETGQKIETIKDQKLKKLKKIKLKNSLRYTLKVGAFYFI